MKKIIQFLIIIPFVLLVMTSCAQQQAAPKVTFIELGSVRCIPCQKMQKVIKKVEEKYPDRVKTVFYDVWTPKGKKASEAYEFDMIPTQVFLDEKGEEFARHVGYFEFDELEKILLQKLK